MRAFAGSLSSSKKASSPAGVMNVRNLASGDSTTKRCLAFGGDEDKGASQRLHPLVSENESRLAGAGFAECYISPESYWVDLIR